MSSPPWKGSTSAMTDTLTAAKKALGDNESGFSLRIAAARLRDVALIPPIIIILIIGAVVSPAFLTRNNLQDVLVSMSWVALLVLAEGIILLTGKMDLSLESTVGLAPGVAACLT